MFSSYLLAILSPFLLFSQEKKEDMVSWSPSLKLTWDDYKGRPDPSSDAAASTTTYLAIEYHIRENDFSFNISCQFSRERSWGLHKTPYILSHEQGHFDIAEIFARKLNIEMSNYRFNKKTFQKDLSEIYNRVMKEKEDFQDRYDNETNHSIKRDRQAQWLNVIEQLLVDTKAAADYK
jgi:hypothetical protein